MIICLSLYAYTQHNYLITNIFSKTKTIQQCFTNKGTKILLFYCNPVVFHNKKDFFSKMLQNRKKAVHLPDFFEKISRSAQ